MPLRFKNTTDWEMERDTDQFIDAYNNKRYEGIVDLGKKVMVESNPRYKEVMAIMRDMSLGHRFTKNIKAIFYAIEYANKLLELGYDVENDYRALAKGYYKLNKYDEMYEASINISDKTERMYYEIIYLSARGKHQEAIDLSNSFLSVCEDDKIITILLTYINNYIRLHDEETAKYIYDNLVMYEPNLRNNKLDSYFDFFFRKEEDEKQGTYIDRQLEEYDSESTINLIYKKSVYNPEIVMFQTKDMVAEYLRKVQDIIRDKEPNRILLADQYIFHEDDLKESGYATDEMVIHTLPNSKKVIAAYPLGLNQDAGKIKLGRR